MMWDAWSETCNGYGHYVMLVGLYVLLMEFICWLWPTCEMDMEFM